MRIAIGSDHAGFELKKTVIAWLNKQEYETEDMGAYTEASCDYPDYAHAVGAAVNSGAFERGILICGSANGVAITANKYPNVRAAICWMNEIVTLARQHNDANILCLPARFIGTMEGLDMIATFLSTAFEGGRHQKRVAKIPIE